MFLRQLISLFMADFNNLTYEPADFLSPLSPFEVLFHCPAYLFSGALKERSPHCSVPFVSPVPDSHLGKVPIAFHLTKIVPPASWSWV